MPRYIDADALWMDIIHNMDYCEDILEFIEAQPTADVAERKRGKWIKGKKSLWSIGKCSVCGAISVEADTANYCPNCGIEMKGSEE